MDPATMSVMEQKRAETIGSLSNAVLSHVFSFLPARETPRMKQLSQKCLQISEESYQSLNLPLQTLIKIEFKEATGAAVSIMVNKTASLFTGIRCTATSLIIHSQFQSAFYYFQRKYGAVPQKIRSGLAIRVPVNSLEEAVTLLLDYLKRNVAIGQLIITDNSPSGGKSILTENIYKIIESFGKSVNFCRVRPILHIDFSPEYAHIYKNMLNNYNGWLCNLKDFTQNDMNAVMRAASTWLLLERQPPPLLFFQMLSALMTNWLENKMDIGYIECHFISKDGWNQAISILRNLKTIHDLVRVVFFHCIMDESIERIQFSRGRGSALSIRAGKGWLEIYDNQ